MKNIALAFLLSFLCFSSAKASDVNINPIRIDLSNTAKIADFTIFNRGSEPVTFEAHALHWGQMEESRWYFSKTNDIAVYPKIITIAPQEKGVIRVGFTGQDAPSEKSYRLFVKELSDPRQKENGVSFRTQINLPIFYRGSGFVQKVYGKATATWARGGVLNFKLENEGNAHVKPQVVTYKFSKDGAPVHVAQGKMEAYALPGRVALWSLVTGFDCTKVDRVDIEGEGDFKSAVALTCPQ